MTKGKGLILLFTQKAQTELLNRHENSLLLFLGIFIRMSEVYKKKERLMKNYPVKKNDVIEVEIVDLTHEGLGVAKVDHYPLFIENALPGEKLEIKVLKTGKSFGYGKVLTVLKSSEQRVPVKDENFTKVGISPLQHLAYGAQLSFKTQQVENVMQRVAKLPEVPVLPTIGMNDPWHYRNKAQIPVRKIDNQLQTGFFRKNSHDLIPMEHFYIQDLEIDAAIVKIRDIMRKYSVKPYNESDNTGNLRHIVVRRGYHTGEMMVVLITRTPKLFPISKIVPDILEAIPEVVSIVQNVNPKRTNVIFGNETILLHGSEKNTDTIFDLKFEISARSFYQVNPQQTEVMYQKVKEYAALTGNEIVVDAYCGIGTIGLTLAQDAKQVYGIEVIEEAVKDAENNAKLNNIENATFTAGLAEELLPKLVENGLQPDVVVVDPPRKGLDGQLVNTLIETQPERIVYVSCNPATLARDIALLTEGGYEAKEIQPVDNFPQTTHIETVALLSKLDVDKHINIEIELDELDLTSAESKATYAQIKEYVWNKFQLKVPTLYIAQIKRKCGIELREHYNKSKKEKQIIPQCTPEKEEAIMDALRHFKMIE
ncbi:23S rRNA (uracil-5-)-methyltransferase RumA [Enterococcus faecalis ERV129]|nr:23S rRNA (uracil(1939)-C(5))-methyltransferase RlmD [Enterococcus faecalis]EJV01179.1 23S rRNA (uracil-5-)-methyltransferase RumA [Enterococcus faecalis ERV129]